MRMCDGECGTSLEGAHGNKRYCDSCTRERKREADRKAYASDPAKKKEAVQRRRRENPGIRTEEARRWRERYPEKNRAKSRRHYWRHRESVLDGQREYRKTDAYRASVKKYQQANPDMMRKHRRKTRIKRAGFIAATLTDNVTDAQIMERDEWRCYLCGEAIESDPSVDHVWPLARGGADIAENKRAAHLRCNQRKNNHLYVVDADGRFLRYQSVSREEAAEWRDMVGPMVE